MSSDHNSDEIPVELRAVPSRLLISHGVVCGQVLAEIGVGDLVSVLRILRDDPECMYTILIDICGADYPARDARFEVVYHFLSIRHNRRVRIKVCTDEDTPVPSVVSFFPAADWFEREVFDMYGVVFSGHPDLRRILTEYDFSGYPLRKDFPVSGHLQVRYDESRKCVVHEPVVLTQDYRQFDFESPWEGLRERISSGDKLSDT